MMGTKVRTFAPQMNMSLEELVSHDHFYRYLDQQAGLVWGKELYADATKVQANAALSSLKPRFAVEAHLAALFTQEVHEQEEAKQESLQQRNGVDQAGAAGQRESVASGACTTPLSACEPSTSRSLQESHEQTQGVG